MSAYSPVDLSDSPAGGFFPTERFEVNQYVRVLAANGRHEIGQVVEVAEDKVVVTTRQGYDLTVNPRNVRRAFLLVLDLNGVLVSRGKGSFVHRPYVDEFMKFVFSNFSVAVWTSGLERSSNPIIESVFNGYEDRLLFKLYRDSCTTRATEKSPWGTVKDLQLIFSRYPESFHSVNTIIVDDSPDKCSHPDIALCPVPFKDPVAQKADDGLKKAIDVLREVLTVDSHAPVIRAAEERLAAIATDEHISSGSGGKAEALPLPATEPSVATRSREEDSVADHASALAEVNLWKSRLCCDNLRGQCTYGAECGYSHDSDDGRRPCSRKNRCPFGHASRWIRTEGDTIVEKRRQERMQYRDKADLYHLSENELRDVGRRGRAHTGIPHEDALLEEEERTWAQTHRQQRQQHQPQPQHQYQQQQQQQQQRQAAVPAPELRLAVGSPETIFSTNPNRQREASSAGGGYANGWQISFDDLASQIASQHQQPQGGGGHHERQRRRHADAQGGGRAHGNAASAGQRGGHVASSGVSGGHPSPPTGVIHLTSNAADATALVRQLQALEAQRKR